MNSIAEITKSAKRHLGVEKCQVTFSTHENIIEACLLT